MKRIILVLLTLVLTIELYACINIKEIENKTTERNETSVKETENIETEIKETEDIVILNNKKSVDEFLKLAENLKKEGLLSFYLMEGEQCYDVTPIDITKQTNAQIFKFSESCASFIVIDSEIYVLCNSFGGYGFVHAEPCDFDNDGNKDLLVASSWGSGLHRSEISIFNTKTKTSTIVYSTIDTDTPDMDLVIGIPFSPTQSEIINEQTDYFVYSAMITYEDNFANLFYVGTDVIGSVILEGGIPVFKPIKSRRY